MLVFGQTASAGGIVGRRWKVDLELKASFREIFQLAVISIFAIYGDTRMLLNVWGRAAGYLC